VGPRPILLSQEERYGDALKYYTRVVPGMTGLWQVSGRNHLLFQQRAKLDSEYIQNWSLWLDIYILLKTIKVVLFHTGAY
jgi:lipopolysaccharide/colanic/teichoic acid biosynthesis glycosyltransferase